MVTWSHFLQRLLCTGEVSFSLPRAPQFLTHSTGLLNISWVNESVWAGFPQEGLRESLSRKWALQEEPLLSKKSSSSSS